MCDVGDGYSQGIGDSTMADDLLPGILSRLVVFASPRHELTYCRAIDKITVTCPSSQDTEERRFGGDKVQWTGEA